MNNIRAAVIVVVLFVIIPIVASQVSSSLTQRTRRETAQEGYSIETYHVDTKDHSSITFTRYVGSKVPPIIFIHGMGCNHLIYDYDENHSLARYLNRAGWDVWLLDLRTHDGDGDYFFGPNSGHEYINRYWDFDNTLLKIDVVTAVDFIKKTTGVTKLVLSGHSYGGYLAYAYAEIIGQENLSGIITTGACPYANPPGVQPSPHNMSKFGYWCGDKAYVDPHGKPWTYAPRLYSILAYLRWKPHADELFYWNTTPEYIQRGLDFHGDSEPAGVYVDMMFGKDPFVYHGWWLDPQTRYNYSKNLSKITVPILFIAGDNDTQDPSNGTFSIHAAYENVSSQMKNFTNFSRCSHLDLLLGDSAGTTVFRTIADWLSALPKAK